MHCGRFAWFVCSVCLAVLLITGTVATADTLSLLRFTGWASCVSISYDAALDVADGGAFTVEAWVHLLDKSGERLFYTMESAAAPISRRGLRDSYTPFSFGIRGGGTKLSAYDPAADAWVETAVSIETGRWYHIAFAHDGSNLRYYTNGVLVGTETFSLNGASDHAVFIGGDDDDTDIDGYVRDVRVWNDERTQPEIENNMLTVLTGGEDNLSAAWRMDDGEGGTVADIMGANDGTIRNFNDTWGAYADGWHNFTLADMDTGSTEFTNSNEVDVVEIPVPPGYTHYEIIEADDQSQLTGSWTALTQVQDKVTFTQPGSDGTNTLYAWVTNMTEDVAAVRGVADIVYTTVKPMASIQGSLSRQTAGFTVRIWPEDLDAGSGGGLFNATVPIGIARLEAVCVDTPGDDQTPAESYVTLSGAGSYDVDLRVVNNAGNVATSASPCTITVASATAAPDDGDLYVAAGNLNAAAPYGTWTTAANSIQNAVNAADTGDVIRVWCNRYRVPTNAVSANGGLNIVNVGEAVTLHAAGPRETLIDGEGENRGIRIAFNYLDAPFVLNGFTVTNCLATYGAGVYYANNNNTSYYMNCRFVDNVVTGEKGSSGGGIYAYGSSDIYVSDCVFRHNRVESPGSGGAIYKRSGSLEISDSLIQTNKAEHTTHQTAGALYLYGGDFIVERTQLLYNRSSIVGNAGSGGATFTFNGDNSSLLVRSCLIVGSYGNSYSMLRSQRDDNLVLTFENCTVTGCRGGNRTVSIRGGSGTLSVYNSIFYDNTGYDFGTIPAGWDPADFQHSIVESVEGGFAGDFYDNGNTNAFPAPQFVDYANGNHRLIKGVYCMNSGTNQAWMDGAQDLDGRPRKDWLSDMVDRGCYEYQYVGSIITIE